jgi:hypothetical protein
MRLRVSLDHENWDKTDSNFDQPVLRAWKGRRAKKSYLGRLLVSFNFDDLRNKEHC